MAIVAARCVHQIAARNILDEDVRALQGHSTPPLRDGPQSRNLDADGIK